MELPKILSPNLKSPAMKTGEKVEAVMEYVLSLEKQIRFALSNLEEDNLGESLKSQLTKAANESETNSKQLEQKLNRSETASIIRSAYARNLLDNSDFTNPVNQRGQTTYTGAGYTIDRWRTSNAYATTIVGNGYVQFKATGGTAIPRQIIKTRPSMIGKTYTAAVCTNGGIIKTVSGTLTSEATGTETTFASGTVITGVTLRIVKSSDVSTISFRIDITAGNSISLRWAALYEGEYTADTLPPYVPKGYTAELDACHERFHRYDSSYSFVGSGFISQSGSAAYIALPVPYLNGDANPTITGSVHIAIPSAVNNSAPTCTTFTATATKTGWIRVQCDFDTVDSTLGGLPCAITIRPGDWLEISRDL